MKMTTSLKAVLTNVDDDEEDEKEEKPLRTSAFMDLQNLRSSVEAKEKQNQNKPTPTTTTTTTTTTTQTKKEEPKKTVDPTETLTSIWQTYKEICKQEDPDDTDSNIRGVGFLKYADDLGVKNFEEDSLLLLICWKLQVNQQHVWEISKEEFLNWNNFKCLSLDDMKRAGLEWKNEIKKDQNKFRNFYFFVFDYLRGDKKVLAIEEVVAAWEMLGMKERWPLFGDWVQFLKGKQAVSRDEWRQLYTFVQKCNKDFSSYSAEDVWPSKFDEFVTWIKEGKPDGSVVKPKEE